MADDLAATWEAVVVAEAAASYAHAIAGPRLADAEQPLAGERYDAHDQARDNALLAHAATGAAAFAIPTFFELPEQVGDVAAPEQARALLALVESRLAITYADLTGILPVEQRQAGLDGVLLATSRALGWGAAPGPWGATEPGA